MEDKEFQHPEGKIQLLDGRVLDCYPLEQPQDEVDNQLSLDTTGVYLSLKRPNKANTVEDDRDDDEKELEKLFLDNAFVFLENRERILSDSRMFCVLCLSAGADLLTQVQVVSAIQRWVYSSSFGWLAPKQVSWRQMAENG